MKERRKKKKERRKRKKKEKKKEKGKRRGRVKTFDPTALQTGFSLWIGAVEKTLVTAAIPSKLFI